MLKTSTLKYWDKKRILRANRGLLTRVAREVGVTPQAVRLIWWGVQKSARIEQALDSALAVIHEEQP